MIAGIGGTGVVTVSAILGMAAHLEGKAASLFDMAGLAQKNGAVFSHVRVAKSADRLHAARLGRGEADALIAFDMVAALSDEAAATLAEGRAEALVNSDVTATVAFQFDRDAAIDSRLLLARIERLVGRNAVMTVDATALAVALLGDAIATNMFLVGAAAQRGILPVGVEAIERAIELNGIAVPFNLKAFRLGRLYIADPGRIAALCPAPVTAVAETLDDVVARQVDHLTAYQNAGYAARYRALVDRVCSVDDSLGLVVARQYGRLLAYKDEYEVARLLTSATLHAELSAAFADGGTLSFNLAPPLLGGKLVNGRPRKREFSARWMLPVLKVMATAKHLRGTAFDPFGFTAERRDERALIDDYERLVAEVLEHFAPSRRDTAAELLGLAAMIRGYGPVKHASVLAYRADLAKKLEAYRLN